MAGGGSDCGEVGYRTFHTISEEGRGVSVPASVQVKWCPKRSVGDSLEKSILLTTTAIPGPPTPLTAYSSALVPQDMPAAVA